MKTLKFLLLLLPFLLGASIVSCNKSDDDSNNVPVADPSTVTIDWKGGEQIVAVRPTQGSRMTKAWTLVGVYNPFVSGDTKERVTIDSTSTPGVKKIYNEWLTLTISDLGREIRVKALRNTSVRQRGIRLVGVCDNNQFTLNVRQGGITF